MSQQDHELSSPSLFFEVYALNQAIGRLLGVAMASSPLTPEEYAIYSAVFEDERITPTRMARRLGTPLTTVMDQIARLEARGHARRTVSATDRRASLVSLTATGMAAHRDANRYFEQAYDLFARALSVDEAKATESLNMLRDAVEAAIASAQQGAATNPPGRRA